MVRAFILYRQHQHAGVVAQHPGLPNPDISKIIGEQWRRLPFEDKNEWKALAEVRITDNHPTKPIVLTFLTAGKSSALTTVS